MSTVSERLGDAGYALFAPHAFADTRLLLTECQKPAALIKRQKSFLNSLAVSQAVVDEVRNLGIESELVGYLGRGTTIQSVALYSSTPRGAGYKSGQLWHLDIDFAPQVKLFFMCRPTDHENGPFTFISAPDSLVVQNTTGYVPGKSLDDTHFQHESVIELVGDAGSLVLIDPSRCFHFGSRCQSGERIALVVQFTA